MQIYVQELVARSFFAALPKRTQQLVLRVARLASHVALAATRLYRAGVLARDWPAHLRVALDVLAEACPARRMPA